MPPSDTDRTGVGAISAPDAKLLLDRSGVLGDAGVVTLADKADAFMKPARTRQWAREPGVRSLA